MRLAILADIHGNLPALEAALAEIEKLHVDRVLVLGDIVVGSPDSLACWQRIKALGCPVLRGNHERYVCDLGTERAKPEWALPQFGPVHYAAAQLGESARSELAVLPATIRLPEAPDVLFVHGSVRNDSDLVFPYTRAADLEPMFVGANERWLIRGHNHYSGVYLWGERRIVTVGSTGLPLDGTPTAQFTVLECSASDWSVQQISVAYDLAAALRRFTDSGYLQTAGPMARLFMREVETAAFHIVPFLKWQKDLSARGESLPLAEAVECFLRH